MGIVYTIGYEGTDITRFIATLQIVGVEAIADVRAVPLSRKKGFSKNSLADILNANGIAYLPFKALGDPKPGREAAKAGKYTLFKNIYSEYLKGLEAQSALKKLGEQALYFKTCLLCFERDYKTCHRHLIGQELMKSGFSIFNLYADEPKRYEPRSTAQPELEAAE